MRRAFGVVASIVLVVLGLNAGYPVGAAVVSPTVTGMSAHSGPLAGGETITVRGSHLKTTHRVTLGSVRARFDVVSASAVRVHIPPSPRSVVTHVFLYTVFGRTPANAQSRWIYVAPPKVTSVTQFAPQTGGGVTVEGYLKAVRKVSVDGQQAKVLSSAATTVRFEAPTHAPGLVPVVITTAGGSVKTHLLYESTAPADVTAAAPFDRFQGQIVGLSCPLTTFCLAIDGSDAVTFDGETWSEPAPTGQHLLDQVSCASATFCVALGGAGGAIFDGSDWTPTDPELNEFLSVSCPAVGQCVAVGISDTAVLDAGVWHRLTGSPSPSEGEISCVRITFCMAVQETVQFVFDGTTWTGSDVKDADGHGPGTLIDVSCRSDVDCSAIDLYGAVWRYQGGVWSISRSVAHSDIGWRAISCGSPQFCVVSDNVETAVVTDTAGTSASVTFERPYYVNIRYLRVSCASATFCVAASPWGAVSRWNGTAWSTPLDVMEPASTMTSIACVSQTECFAADQVGTVVPYDGVSWGEPVRVDPWRLGPTIVSCATSGLCATISTHGNLPADFSSGTAAVLTGGTWQATADVLPEAVAISCADALCVAVSATQYSTYDAASNTPAWSAAADLPAPGAPPPGGNAVSVACTGTADCVVTFGTGYSHFDGHAWSTVTPISQAISTGLVGCAAAGPCLARNSGFSILRTTEGVWGRPTRTAEGPTGGDMGETCGGSTCLSLTGREFQVYSAGIWSTAQTFPSQYFYPVGAACMPDATCLIGGYYGEILHVTPPTDG